MTLSRSRSLSRDEIIALFTLLNEELALTDTHAELCLVGGAVMCLSLNARAATRDVDAWFQPAERVREAAARVATRADVPDNWLNDAVQGWLGVRGAFDHYWERPHLQLFVAQPQYVLAMKCMAMRLGEEFRDLDDIRFLLRYLNIARATDALAIVSEYFEAEQIPVKTRLALEELLDHTRSADQ